MKDIASISIILHYYPALSRVIAPNSQCLVHRLQPSLHSSVKHISSGGFITIQDFSGLKAPV
jgi:hypothetical protein